MRLRLRLPAVALVALALLAGCGGDDGSSADDYRAELNAACTRLGEANARVPQQLRDDGLTIEQARELIERNGERFFGAIEALDPPDELRDAHDRLIALRDADTPDGDVDEVREWLLGVADLYDELGADACERQQRESARAVVEAPEP